VIDLSTGEALGPNKEGEICAKGPLIMAGYLGDAVSTQLTVDSEGWLHTGDIGYYDEEQYFYIVDRLKELIKYKAFQVAPAELEAILLQNSEIKDCGVVGLPDEAAGELPLAFIVLQPGSKLTEQQIKDFVAKKVSYHKRLHGGVIFLQEIPRNPSGKILRRDLRLLVKTVKKSKL